MKSDWFEEIIFRSNSNMLRLERINSENGNTYTQKINQLVFNPILNKYIPSKGQLFLKRSCSLSNKSKINNCGLINLNFDTILNSNQNLDGFLLPNNQQDIQRRNRIKRNATSLFMQNNPKSNQERTQITSKILKRRNERIIFHELTDFPPEQNKFNPNFAQSEFISNSNLSNYLIKFMYSKKKSKKTISSKELPKE